MAAPTPTLWYRLTNTFTGPTMSLDVVNDSGPTSSGELQMAPTGNYSGQYWQLVHYPYDSSPTFALFTEFLGANKRLDVYGNDATMPHLGDAGDYTGQIWTISAWGDGTWMLTNQYSGSGLHLDVYSDTKVPFMGDGDHTGQHWIFTEEASVSPFSSTTSSLKASPSSTTTTISPSFSTTSSHKSRVAIIVGAAVGVVTALAVLAIVLLLLRRARHKRNLDAFKHHPHQGQQELPVHAPMASPNVRDAHRPVLTPSTILSSDATSVSTGPYIQDQQHTYIRPMPYLPIGNIETPVQLPTSSVPTTISLLPSAAPLPSPSESSATPSSVVPLFPVPHQPSPPSSPNHNTDVEQRLLMLRDEVEHGLAEIRAQRSADGVTGAESRDAPPAYDVI